MVSENALAPMWPVYTLYYPFSVIFSIPKAKEIFLHRFSHIWRFEPPPPPHLSILIARNNGLDVDKAGRATKWKCAHSTRVKCRGDDEAGDHAQVARPAHSHGRHLGSDQLICIPLKTHPLCIVVPRSAHAQTEDEHAKNPLIRI